MRYGTAEPIHAAMKGHTPPRHSRKSPVVNDSALRRRFARPEAAAASPKQQQQQPASSQQQQPHYMLGTEESQRHEHGKYRAEHETGMRFASPVATHTGGVAPHTHSPYSSSPLSDARATPLPSSQQQQQQQQQQQPPPPAPLPPYRASPGSPDPLAMHSPGHVAKQQRMIVEQYRRIDEVEGQLTSLTLRWRSR
jgi:hypothetical protein